LAITKIKSPKGILETLKPAQVAFGVRTILYAAAIFVLSRQHDLWPIAVALVLIVELWRLRPGSTAPANRVKVALERMSAILIGSSLALFIAVSPRVLTQVAFSMLYVVWAIWWESKEHDVKTTLINLLVVQIAVFEALFLMSAVWRSTEWIVLILVWGGCYLSVYSALTLRAERMAGVMAATWALVATEISWVFLRWLFVYTLPGGYLLVPQPTIVLTAIAYCFGSIYISQRQGNLSRGRLTEYLLIGLILITIVITGTPWRGSL
jgi:hypothetical protein